MTTRTTTCICAALTAAVTMTAGCSTSTPTTTVALQPTGYLTTYRNLETTAPGSQRYVDPNNRLERYDKFIVQPVEVRLAHASDLTEEELETIRMYLHDAIVEELSQRYEIVSTPSWNTAEVRIAVTNIQKSAPILNVIPRPKMIDVGLGGLAMEGEIIDSVSSVQIAALIESRLGQNRTFDLTQLDDTKPVMDEWARHFAGLIDTAHGFAIARR